MADQKSNERRRCPAASLTDDLVVEILSRVPAKSLCRFTCVSKAWRALLRNPEHCRKLPQTLTGFFHESCQIERSFVSAPGKVTTPCFDFLPMRHELVMFVDCCKGLLLFRWYSDHGSHYLVCNPATETWAVLPDSSRPNEICDAHLGFDPAVSPHFHVFELSRSHASSTGVEVYSSQSGGWVHTGSKNNMMIYSLGSPSVFIHGCLHALARDRDFKAKECVAVIDTEAKIWSKVDVPRGGHQGFIQQSKGRLHYAHVRRHGSALLRLEVYSLEDYGGQNWTLKHSVESSHLVGQRHVDFVTNFQWVGIHPDYCNLVFFNVGRENATLMRYDMDRPQVKVICSLGRLCWPPYRPYVPLYSNVPALHK